MTERTGHDDPPGGALEAAVLPRVATAGGPDGGGGADPELLRRDLLFPGRYAWYVFVGSLDVMLTLTVIREFGAEEVNTIANHMLQEFGARGLIGLKSATVILVILICDAVGRRQPAAGRRLAEWAIALSAVPVVISLIQIALIALGIQPIPFELDVDYIK